MYRSHSIVGVALVATVLSFGLPGCGGGGSSTTTTPANYTPDGRALPGQTNLSTLRFKISADKATYKTGDPISLTISVTNSSTSQSTVTFPTASQNAWWGYVIAQNGKIVSYEYWPGHNLLFPQVIGTDTYAPGQTKTFTYAFPYTPSAGSPPQVSVLPPGTYQVYARLPALLFDNGNRVANDVPTPVSDAITLTITN